MHENQLSIIHFRSFNPYESKYPGLRVVTRETLHLIKTLRSQGYIVFVEPEDSSQLNYIVEKGFHELLSDPVVATIINIPVSILAGILSTWIYDQLKRIVQPEENKIIVEVDDQGKAFRYNQSGKPVSERQFASILSFLNDRQKQYQKSQKVVSTIPEHFIPINLEHTLKIIGWAKSIVPKDDGLWIDEVNITDDESWTKIKTGELQGFSIAGIVQGATCMICDREYVACNHITGQIYNGKKCLVRINKILTTEISLVKDPIQPLARITRIN